MSAAKLVPAASSSDSDGEAQGGECSWRLLRSGAQASHRIAPARVVAARASAPLESRPFRARRRGGRHASRHLLRHRFRHLELGRRRSRRRGDAPGRARARLSRPCRRRCSIPARRGPRPRAPPPCEFGRAAIAAYVDGIDGRLMRSMKSILGSSLIEQTTDVGGGRGVRYLDVVADLPAPPAAARPRRRPARRSTAPCSAGRSSSSTTTPSATPRPRRRCAAPRAQAGFREVEFQYEPIAAAFDYEQARDARGEGAGRRHRRRHLRLLARPRRPRAQGDGSIARATSSPTTASTSPAPTSTGASSWRRILPLFGYGAYGAERRRRAGARGAERGLLRPRDLAPDQHRLQPAARRRAARHALVLRRPGAAPAADDGRERAPRPRPRSRAPRAPRSRSPTAARATIDLDHVEAGLARELDEARRARRARRRPRSHRRRGARDGGAGRPRRRTRSTRSTSPAARPGCDC